jgi:hypothetical protein
VTVLTDVRVFVDVSREGGLWVARSPAPFGDLELQIQGHERVTNGTEVRGSIKGSAIDIKQIPGGRRGLAPEFALTISVGTTIGIAASAEGVAERTGRYISGTISGEIEYSNNLGNVTSCPSVTWSLQPVP